MEKKIRVSHSLHGPSGEVATIAAQGDMADSVATLVEVVVVKMWDTVDVSKVEPNPWEKILQYSLLEQSYGVVFKNVPSLD